VVENKGPDYSAKAYDGAGKETKTATGRLQKKDDSFVVKGLPQDLAIIKQDSNTNPVAFKYGGASNPMEYFSWKSDQKGVSNQFDKDGKYCKINAKNGNDKNIVCYFPCPAK